MLNRIWAVSAAVGLHAALLGSAWLSPDGIGPGGAHGPHADAAKAPTPTVQVRWTQAPSPSLQRVSSLAQSMSLWQNAPPMSVMPTPTPTPTPREADPAPQTQAQAPLDAPQPPAQAMNTPGEGPDDTYLPRSALSAGPRPLGAVVVNYPLGVRAGGDKLSMVLALYIDENGHVRRTEPQGERLEPAFEQAANDAFLQARFQPGELQGQAVKSRILIEVSFERDASAPRLSAQTAMR